MAFLLSAPLSIATTLATTIGTQLVCCCSSQACHCCNKALTPASSTATRAAYAVMFLVVSVFAWTTQTGWVNDLFNSIPGMDYQCPTGRCEGPLVVLRMMFGLTVFHAVMALLVLGVKDSKSGRAGVQNGWWGVKIGAWVVLTVIAYLIPNDFFKYYGYASFVGAVFFLFIQLVLLIDFAASWSESWVGKYEETGEKRWVVLLIGAVILMLLSTLVLTILLYTYFCTSAGCGLNIFFVTFNLILSILICVMCVHPKIQDAKPTSGLLQGATVSLYMTYLIASAVSDEVNDNGSDSSAGGFNCNPFASSSAANASTIIGTLFTFIVIAFSTTRAAAKSKLLLSSDAVPETVSAVEDNSMLMVSPTPAVIPAATTTTVVAPTASAPMAGGEEESASAKYLPIDENGLPKVDKSAVTNPEKYMEIDEKNLPKLEDNAHRRHLEAAVEEGAMPRSVLSHADDDHAADTDSLLQHDDENDGTTYNYSFFHIIFATAAMYIAMLLTNWDTANPASGELVNVGHDWVTVWVKVVSSWVVCALFVWTLIAPIVLPDREWS